jgi:Zn-dependent alcohol dehydrogenase
VLPVVLIATARAESRHEHPGARGVRHPGAVPLRSVHQLLFDEINEAVADLRHGKTIKAVLVTGSA